MVYTLIDLNVLEGMDDGKFGFGPRFYVLGSAAGNRSELIRRIPSLFGKNQS